MNLKRFVKSAVISVAVALLVLVLGVAGEITWLVLGLPGVHRTGGAPATALSIGMTYFDDDTISQSDAYISSIPTYTLAVVGLIVGFWWACRRESARTLREQSAEAP
jgi:hypothetical protein